MALEAQRATLGDRTVDMVSVGLQEKLASLEPVNRVSSPLLGGERKLVTLMFADLSGLTALSE